MGNQMGGQCCPRSGDGMILSEVEPEEDGKKNVGVPALPQRNRELKTSPASNPSDFKNTIVFVDNNGNDMMVKFTKAPAGMAFDNKLPIVITKVVQGGHAEALGVRPGFRMKSISGKTMDEFAGFPEVKQEIVNFTKNL
mmetsp:Transcript_136057/g.236414  ORF Transcript_136057/g.236414 Transcript_136057/m.236414 type:complete len:139 (-) Transcript_136057:199-615(-)